MNNITDIIGQEIKVGSVITYSVRRYSSMWSNVAVVRNITQEEGTYNRTVERLHVTVFEAGRTRNTVINNGNTVVVLNTTEQDLILQTQGEPIKEKTEQSEQEMIDCLLKKFGIDLYIILDDKYEAV